MRRNFTPRQPASEGPDVVFIARNEYAIFVDGRPCGIRSSFEDANIEARRVYFTGIEYDRVVSADIRAELAEVA